MNLKVRTTFQPKKQTNNYKPRLYKKKMKFLILPSVGERMGSNENVPSFELNEDQNFD